MPGWVARMSEPSGWIRDPSDDVVVRQRRDEQRQLVGRRRHVRVGEHDQVRGRVEHPGPDRRALAAVRHRRSRSGASRRAATCASGRAVDERGRGVGAAVVDDEDLDPLGEAGRARRAVARALAATPQVAEQLVERRADPFRLVEGRQDDGQAGGQGHRRKSTGRVAVGWSC